ncbi:serine/threonine protein kinase [Streptomyces lunaelactis]|uniref:non-specific serine/threonine protein kinase n=1 Tax=Streptomyces lunaelactis TaxID=1535768 RepID=A0A2R4T255_9ACTN|nr:serine/threonine-protein kinase [Streptomyces lunaelactis]AVZ73137.1 serine/threonine protein kinase [Streptomyces lunaelactis]NUK90069.1 serine/threonine protein kinase [Streptomyces lunaelactis]
MSNYGGSPHGNGEPTSFILRPPQPDAPHPDPDAPHRLPQRGAPQTGAPYAAPTQQAAQPQVDASDPGVGRLIAGRYRLLAKLGHGGMGTVWRAEDETVGREVAVKEPRIPDHLPERERANAFERMRREARAAARLDHPAVVNVHDVAVEDGQPWIVMELLRGHSLGAVLQEGTLGTREAARIGLQVLGALEAAHQGGILHRDVKPDNVLLGHHDRVVLADFGIAQIEGETSLTDTGGFVGSPEFIAPERVLGQRPGPASDLWSLGVVLYAATEGVSPFRRGNTPATLQAVLNTTPAAPAAAQGPLAQAINGLLLKDPSQRLSADRVRLLLEEAAAPPPPAPTVVHSPSSGEGGRQGVTLSRRTLLGAGGAVVAAFVAMALVLTNPFAADTDQGDKWKQATEKQLGATLSVPDAYKRWQPAESTSNEEWIRYEDPSGAVWIRLDLIRKDDPIGIAGSAAAEAYDDAETYRESGSTKLDIGSGSGLKMQTKADVAYKGKKAATNSGTYLDTSDSDNPAPREFRIFYYKTDSGDMYKLTVLYPGKGDLTVRGREVAERTIKELDITKL